MSPYLIPQDKANHEAYGARIAMVLAVLAIVAVSLLRPGAAALMLGGIVAIGGAFVAGKAKEMLDARANAAALAEGEPPPHSVEAADVRYTVYGGIAVGAPLIIAGLMALM